MATVTTTEAKPSSNLQHMIISTREKTGSPMSVTRQASQPRRPRLIQQTNGTWTSMPLEVLEKQNKPQDLTGQVSVHDGPPVDIGGYATIHVGDFKGTQVAIKAFKNRQIPGRSLARNNSRLPKEIRVGAALSHPNILEFCGYITDFGEKPCMVSKWYQNGNANRYLNNNELSNVELWGIVKNVADGLAYLHALNITHGDLTPKNILIDDQGVARLCDFSLINLVDWHGSISLNSTAPVGGVPRYQAPELIPSKSNFKPGTTFASDIYSFACVIYEFLTGKRPFDNCEFSHEIIAALKRNEWPASKPESLASSSEEKLWNLLDHCWNSDAGRRPSMEEVISVLKEITPTDLLPRKQTALSLTYQHRPSLEIDPRAKLGNSLPQPHENFQDSPIERSPIPPPRENDEYILVMGLTGSGKTKFINDVTGSKLPVGHLLDSCTDHVNFSKSFELAGRSIILFDTPGLDDTHRDDADIFTEITVFLAQFHEQKRRLIGIIYIHDINERRTGGTAVRNLEVFRRAVGDTASKNVVIITTKWDRIDEAIGNDRHAQLERGFFKTILDAGARIRKLTGGQSGIDIVRDMIEHHTRATLQIQIDFKVDGKQLKDTAAGNVLDKDYERMIDEIRDHSPLNIGFFLAGTGEGGRTSPDQRRREARAEKVKNLEEKRSKMTCTFEEFKRTSNGQRVSALITKILKSILPKRRKSRGMSTTSKRSLSRTSAEQLVL